uniref:Tyrosinase copper-binding domain-containing protein n=1 Tax=Leptobrachium leishanense TaxID=445787 RepID=A0A8C5N068_9ANUR
MFVANSEPIEPNSSSLLASRYFADVKVNISSWSFWKVMLTSLLFLLCLGAVNAVFPTACTTPEALSAKICCPEFNGSECGIVDGRGECRIVTQDREMGKEEMVIDDRMKWMSFYYDKICICKGNYSGPDCGNCAHHLVEPDCIYQKTVMRRDLKEYSLQQRVAFFATLDYCKKVICPYYKIIVTGDRHHKDTLSFWEVSYLDLFNFQHYYSTKPILSDGSFTYATNFAHYSSSFLTWHRAMLIFLEHLIRLCISDQYFALPYGDWRNDPGCSYCNDDFLGASDRHGRLSKYSVFSTWTCVCSEYDYINRYCMMPRSECERQKIFRKPGQHPSARKPNARDVENALQFETYDRAPFTTSTTYCFRPVLEGFISSANGWTRGTYCHNLWHVYLQGTMSRVPIAACDPLFILHHAFMDK